MPAKLTLRIVRVSQADTTRLRNTISKKIATGLVEDMKSQARHRLSYRTSSIYTKALSIGHTESGETKIFLKGWLPVALERGVGRFDMKPGLLRGPKAKISKSGTRYNIIPIQKGSLSDSPDFRIVSDKSPKHSWIHPGLDARGFTKIAVENLRRSHPESFSARAVEGRGIPDFY